MAITFLTNEDGEGYESRLKALEDSQGSGENSTQFEPAADDIPKVFFVGTTPTTKAEDELPLTMEYISKTKRFFAYVTLKVQGDSSAGYPLKNFNMKMFSDEARTQKLKMKFRGWKVATHKFCLKKNWIDILNIRNVFNGRLWGQVVRTRADYESYPAEYRESSNCGAVDGFPIKVYVNGVYQGLYTWNIRKDDSMFGMDDSTGTHAALIADASNTRTWWRELPNVDGTDWTDELNDTVPAAVLTGFRNATDFVMGSTDEEFRAGIEQYFYKSSLIDYYCFIYAIQMPGGLAKSQTVFTYDAQRFLANIYDMDTTWRLMWDGSGFYPVNMTCPEGYMAVAGQERTNLLYEKLLRVFPDEIRERYFELRNGPLSTANVNNEAERFSDPLVAAGLYAEEVAETTPYGPSRPSKDTNTIQHLRQSIAERLPFVDEQMAKLRSPVAATSIELSASELTFTEKEPHTLTATVEPADTTDIVVWSTSDDTVATVADGVITPVANGDAIITATAGSVSAECAISVEYAVKDCTSITLSASTLTFTGAGTQTLTATVEPADTTDAVIWESDDPTIATVDGGVVTARWNGVTTIRAVCGAQTAECIVTISGIESTPLTGVDLMNGYTYDETSGALTQKANRFCTERFRMDSGKHTVSFAHGLEFKLHVWGADDSYIGNFAPGDTSADGGSGCTIYMVARADYKYALAYKYTFTESDSIDSLSIQQNEVTAPGSRLSITLSDHEFVEFNSKMSYIDLSGIDGVVDNIGINLENVAASNALLFTTGTGTSNATSFPPGANAYGIRKVNSGGYKPYLMIAGTPDEINAYFAEHNTVLIFN